MTRIISNVTKELYDRKERMSNVAKELYDGQERISNVV